MNLVRALLSQVGAVSPGPADDFWYGPVGTTTYAGVDASPDSAMRVSAVWACVLLLSETIASLPLMMYQRRGDGGKDRATQHPIYTLLHDQPNRSQTAFEFRQQLTAQCLLRGNAYARIVPGPRGPVDRLISIHPDMVRVEQQDQDVVYRVRDNTGRETVYSDSEIFHLRGLTLDGVTGVSVITYARETIGISLATESYGARLFSQNARPGGVLMHPGKLSPEATRRLRDDWQSAHAGLSNAHQVAVLQEGMKWEAIGMTNEDAEFLATREFEIEDVARWFRVPLHMISSTTKATSWGSGIAELSQGFVTYTLLPWLRRWEQAIARDLIAYNEKYFAEFVVEGLLRGNITDRYNAYATGRNWGWLSVNDVRERENLNPVENGDVYLQPLNMQEAGAPPPPAPKPAPVESTPADESPAPPPVRKAAVNGHYLLMVEEAASRVVRKETMALSKAGQRAAKGLVSWTDAVREFYGEHAGYVSDSLRVPLATAERWCAEQRSIAETGGAAVVRDWEAARVGDLVALVLGQEPEEAA